MIIGIAMLLIPMVVYLASVPLSRRLRPRLCLVYRVVAGLIVVAGSSISVYFAAYGGDQGGIAAYLFQLAVIGAYGLFSILVVGVDWLARKMT